MSQKYHLRADGSGHTGLYINDTLVISNLDERDIASFRTEFDHIVFESPCVLSVNNKIVHPPGVILNRPETRGRKLLLAQHENIIRELIDHNPLITALEIKNRLRGIGIKFSSVTAVTNLARARGFKLAA